LNNFEPLENKIDFWLFQMPANFKFKPENLERVKSFFNSENIMHQIISRKKAVIEFRDSSWWNEPALEEIEKAGIVFCSVDAPSVPNEIITTSDAIYLRLHGTKTVQLSLSGGKVKGNSIRYVRKASTEKGDLPK
jgi:uncharacterized protein YecE (DUF72 family)